MAHPAVLFKNGQLESTGGADDKLFNSWQKKIFASLWIAYACYYFCRVNYAVAQPGLAAEFGWSKTDMGFISSAYLAFYAIGQFVNGQLGDQFGARKMIFFGLMASVACNMAFGMSSSIPAMVLLWTINGYMQSSGWPVVVRTVSNWFPLKGRGVIMGFMSTSYQIGNALAWILTGAVVDHMGWRSAFWVPAAVALCWALIFRRVMRDHPQELGLAVPENNNAAASASKGNKTGAEETLPWTQVLRLTVSNKILWTLAATYFCLKLVRYGFLTWAITYFVEVHQAPVGKSAFSVAIMPLAGSLGAIAGGYISDKYFQSRRAPVCTILLAILALLCYGFLTIPAGRWIPAVACLAAIGIAIYGPDALVSGAAVIDFGHPKAVACASGLVESIGSAGAVFSGVGTGFIVDRWGWSGGLILWIIMSLAAAVLMSTLWNSKPQKSGS